MGNCSTNLNTSSSQSNNNLPTSNLSTSYRSFNVYNVDARLFRHSRGRIHITNNEMVLNNLPQPRAYMSRNSPNNSTINNDETPIEWPLNGIRRYGYHKDIFLFECGRRCPTGEGLYAFRCKKANHLNDLLHKSIIQNSNQLTSDISNQINGKNFFKLGFFFKLEI
jgi:hypothetical protein